MVYKILNVSEMVPSHLPPPGGGRDEVGSPTMAINRPVDEKDIGDVQDDGSLDQDDTQGLDGTHGAIPK